MSDLAFLEVSTVTSGPDDPPQWRLLVHRGHRAVTWASGRSRPVSFLSHCHPTLRTRTNSCRAFTQNLVEEKAPQLRPSSSDVRRSQKVAAKKRVFGSSGFTGRTKGVLRGMQETDWSQEEAEQTLSHTKDVHRSPVGSGTIRIVSFQMGSICKLARRSRCQRHVLKTHCHFFVCFSGTQARGHSIFLPGHWMGQDLCKAASCCRNLFLKRSSA